MQFIAYFLNAQNMAKLAQGDWLIPANPAAGTDRARRRPRTRTAGASRSPRCKTPDVAPFQSLDAYPQWKDQIATPAFQQYFAEPDRASTTSAQKLTDGWSRLPAAER